VQVRRDIAVLRAMVRDLSALAASPPLVDSAALAAPAPAGWGAGCSAQWRDLESGGLGPARSEGFPAVDGPAAAAAAAAAAEGGDVLSVGFRGCGPGPGRGSPTRTVAWATAESGAASGGGGAVADREETVAAGLDA
jgi:hypothetical protein